MEYLILYLIGYFAFFYLATCSYYMNDDEPSLGHIAYCSIAWPLILAVAILVTFLENMADLAKKRHAK